MADLHLRGLTRRYDTGRPAVDAIDLSVADGEFVVLVGPSGCGKSTTLRMIAGLEPLDGGEIVLGGRPVQHLDPGARDVAMVFQNYALYPHMSVARNLGFGLRKRGLSRTERKSRVEEVARLLELDGLMARKPAALSGGQRQRVAMGRAIVRDPALFLFDEPLSNLDARLRTQMRTEIKRLARVIETTCIYVTHDQVEAMTMADRVVVMRAGRIEQAGSPMEIYDRPATRFVAEFLGAPAMTIVPAQITQGGARIEAFGADLEVPVPRRAAFAPLAGQRLDLGLRPEDFHLWAPGSVPRPGTTLEARVEVVEALGVETLLHVALGAGLRATARTVPRAAPLTGAHIALRPDLSRAHLFDAATGAALAPPPATPAMMTGDLA
ncbi:sugar ABC transporter ATPase [Thioclava dalianensis]|uniref:Sugar ABC transporter ATPase n=1 Tax=Thioclava dalianensis TaxID=1185766 RepID=A0A074TGB9_9RHOB|nr:sn-glycerol-3-phosphate ABC transporter ATP-binding protein UgpC [Thioclava dalianensis]KEP68108.1 sugar ABC transporter ATPase [Thioclava dalianensis]SFN39057.1 sn-glycerol 3-phosphate transport system ATP-binding protein/multiple sugar transport system ATP-binding protein [Thioclava dalianensis]